MGNSRARRTLPIMKTNLLGLGPSLVIALLGLTSLLAGCGDDTAPATPPAPELSAELKADLQAALDQAVADKSTPGTSLYVFDHDETWSGAAGVAEIEGNVPMTPNDRFRTGSMLKPLVATAVLQSVEKGKLDLHDLITTRLPADLIAKVPNADKIDVGMLLGHRSGIAEWVTPAVRQAVVSDPAHVWTIDEVLGQIAALPPVFAPGESFGYSNTNYMLLGEILTGVEGRVWREVVREEVIARAGMKDTTLPDPGDMACTGCAHGYVAMNGTMLDTTIVDPSMAGASGGHALISTAADMAHFLTQLRAGALFEKKETLDAMFAFLPASDPQAPLVGYGLGMMKLDAESVVLHGHLGMTAGYSGFMLYLPATDRYVAGVMNIMGDPSAVITPVVERLAQP